MLAFTMQFSRYGRKLGSLGASAPRELKPVSNRVSALRKQLLPQDPTVCSEPLPLSVLVPLLPVGENVLTEQPQKSGPNSQCSTRKHGRPVTHSVTRDARCSLERR